MSVTVQIAIPAGDIPAPSAIEKWVHSALAPEHRDAEVTVRIVDRAEGRALNARWRGRDYATNVLAFPLDGLDLEPPLLGDVVICADVANAEAGETADAREAHWAHLVIHGVLHLLGHDHEHDAEAEKMEALERTILIELGYPDIQP